MNLISDLMLGEGVLGDTVWWCQKSAMEEGTPEAFEIAAERIRGIWRLWAMARQNMPESGGVTEALMLQNAENQMRQAATCEVYRARMLAALTQARKAA